MPMLMFMQRGWTARRNEVSESFEGGSGTLQGASKKLMGCHQNGIFSTGGYTRPLGVEKGCGSQRVRRELQEVDKKEFQGW